MGTITGLTEHDVQIRRQQGLGNKTTLASSRSYWDIARTNVFTVFNNILFAVGVALIALGRISDALISVGMGLLNALISTLQEMRAKRQLDRIALLATPQVTVIREGQEKVVAPDALVQGDIIRVSAGDQIVVDGVMVGDGLLEMDESLLTGEADLIRKQAGDPLLSGSFCVTGSGYLEAQKVGDASFANQLTATARQFQVVYTPLQRTINLVVRVVMLIVVIMSIIILVAGLLEGLSTLRLVQIAAVLSGQVPYGLFLMIVVAYSLGAAAMAKQGALVQQVNAIESLSTIDILCVDKTGTLTTNRLAFHALYPLLDMPQATISAQLGDVVRSASASNPTSDAIMAALPGTQRPAIAEVPFASARKWSALAFDQPERRGVYVLGAVEMLRPYLPSDAVTPNGTLDQQVQTWSAQGLRVLLFAYNPAAADLYDDQDQPRLPPLTPLALVSLRDELRPQVRETIAAFQQLGVELKVISGDNPQTVAALARQAGLPEDIQAISGPELAAMSQAEFDQAAAEVTIFGRITPEQKDRLVGSLQRQGKRVAMLGDGVNDVLALKKASLGIAMQNGSSAARNVADMILMQNSFAVLRPAFHEGRRIISGMTNVLYLSLSRVATTTLIIIAVTMVGLDFPFDPAQTGLTAFTIGVPSFLLTLWARPQPQDAKLLSSVVRFVFTVAVVTMVLGLAIYLIDYNFLLRSPLTQDETNQARALFESYTGVPFGTAGYSNVVATLLAQGSLSIFISWTACLLIVFLEPPSRFLLGWRKEISPDKRPAWLALALFFGLLAVSLYDPVGYYFGILEKPLIINMLIMLLVVLWFFIIRTIWRARLVERFLGLEYAP